MIRIIRQLDWDCASCGGAAGSRGRIVCEREADGWIVRLEAADQDGNWWGIERLPGTFTDETAAESFATTWRPENDPA